MYLYKVKETYIDYLKNEDVRVLDNKKNRPYLGVVLEIEGIDYYVPLSSEKESKRVNTQLSMKIKDLKGEVIGYLQFLNMIPVHVDDLITLDVDSIKEIDPEYYNIIAKEMIFIRKNKYDIIKKAQQV